MVHPAKPSSLSKRVSKIPYPRSDDPQDRTLRAFLSRYRPASNTMRGRVLQWTKSRSTGDTIWSVDPDTHEVVWPATRAEFCARIRSFKIDQNDPYDVWKPHHLDRVAREIWADFEIFSAPMREQEALREKRSDALKMMWAERERRRQKRALHRMSEEERAKRDNAAQNLANIIAAEVDRPYVEGAEACGYPDEGEDPVQLVRNQISVRDVVAMDGLPRPLDVRRDARLINAALLLVPGWTFAGAQRHNGDVQRVYRRAGTDGRPVPIEAFLAKRNPPRRRNILGDPPPPTQPPTQPSTPPKQRRRVL